MMEDSQFATWERVVVTVLAHPDLRRVGDRVTLSEGELAVGIGRAFPTFRSEQGEARSLDVPYLSRHPVALEPHEGGLWIARSSGVASEGIRGEDGTHVSRELLLRGARLILADRILLHLRLDQDGSLGLKGEEEVAFYFAQALIERLEELGRDELIDRDPPWLPPGVMGDVLGHPFRDAAAVAALACQIAVGSPDRVAEFSPPA